MIKMNINKSFIMKTTTNVTMIFLSSCIGIIFFLLFVTTFQDLYAGVHSHEYVVWFLIFGAFTGFIGGVFATYMFLLTKYILINEEGVTTFLGNKISKEIKWKDINVINITIENNELVYIIIKTNEHHIELFRSEYKGQMNAFESIFNELLKYQPKYGFYVGQYVKNY